jgi:hypothetical protein
MKTMIKKNPIQHLTMITKMDLLHKALQRLKRSIKHKRKRGRSRKDQSKKSQFKRKEFRFLSSGKRLKSNIKAIRNNIW